MSFADIMKQLSTMENGYASISLATNQGNGIVSYGAGALSYVAGASKGPIFSVPSLKGSITCLFSDRLKNLSGPGGFAPSQPFDIGKPDKIGLNIYRPPGSATLIVKLTLESWGNVKLTFNASELDTEIVGVGPAIGHGAAHAVYVISLFSPQTPPSPPK